MLQHFTATIPNRYLIIPYCDECDGSRVESFRQLFLSRTNSILDQSVSVSLAVRDNNGQLIAPILNEINHRNNRNNEGNEKSFQLSSD